MKVTQLATIGLNTFANPLNCPPGSLTQALNVVIDKPNQIETRRGFDFYGTQLSVASGPIIKMAWFAGALIVWYNNGDMAYDSDGNGTWVGFSGTYLPPVGGFVNTALANGNLYFTTSNGVYKLDALANTPQPAGAPRGLDGTTSLNAVSGGFLANDSQVAYRVVWGYIDANTNTILGTPSDFMYVSNSGSAASVTLKLPIPAQANSTAWFYQLYRTPNTGSLTITPGDNLQLTIELNLTSTNLTNGYVQPTDNTPDALLGAYLYTDSTQLGETQTNDQPPLCQDLCWNSTSNTMLFLNCQTEQSMYITMDSVGSPYGVQAGDTITINGFTLTAVTSGATNGQFNIVTGGTPASNIDGTARNLELAINAYTANTSIAAYYTSTATSLPGTILLEARNYSQGVFYATASRATSWDPEIPSTGTTYFSANSALPNQVYCSQPGQPEAVPIGNVIPVGSRNFQGYRIFSLRTGALTYKADGVFLLSGTTFPLQVIPVDTTVFMFGANTAAPLNNSIFSFTTQAVTQGAESGVEIKSHTIEQDLLDLATNANFASMAFGVQYESYRKYILFLPSTPESTYPDLAYVYNWVTDTWVTWGRDATAGVVPPKNSTITAGDTLYLARPDGWVVKERKSLTSNDYADEHLDINITAVGATTFTLTNATGVSIGDVIEQGSLSAVVTSVDTVTNVVGVDTVYIFSTGAAVDYTSYPQMIAYQPLNGGWPNATKRWSTIQFAFANINFNSVLLSLSSDFYPNMEQTILVPKATGQWGNFPWGSLPFGQSAFPDQIINTYPGAGNCAVNTLLNVTLTLNQAFQNFGLSGVTGNFNIIGERWF
jgi:hypothetical protein